MPKAAPVHWCGSTASATITLAPVESSPPPKLRDLAEALLRRNGFEFKGAQSEEFSGGTLVAFRGSKMVGGTFSAAYVVAMVEADGSTAWMELMGRREKEQHFRFISNRMRSQRRSQRGKEL